MKKMISMILAVILVMALACTAMADEIPEPEGGKKFNSNWAVQNAVIEIYYEEEGYRVSITSEDPDEGVGTEWFYNCFYVEEEDALVSISSGKCSYTFDPEYPDDITYGEPEYEGIDDEGKNSVFIIDENGRLIWADGHENAGQDLEFINIGRFDGAWKNEEEAVYTVISWNGYDDQFYYDVYLQRGESDAETYVIFNMTGVYNEKTDKLECTGPAVTYTNGTDEGVADDEVYEAFFSWTEDGTLLFEAANGIELEEDFDNNG